MTWDFKKGDKIEYFDREKSYELTGYRPITDTQGLDFDIEPFIQTRRTKERTGHYTALAPKTRAYMEFLTEEYKRCIYGMTVGDYTVTGMHYFFLNYYQLKETRIDKAAMSQSDIFPRFMVAQYEFFHYFEMCRLTGHNCVMMKSRGVGFSEIMSSIAACIYHTARNSIVMITAAKDPYVKKTLEKIWKTLDYLNDSTDRIFFKARQVNNSNMLKKASHIEYEFGMPSEKGFKSQIAGIVADDPSKIRGDRVSMLLLEEAGSNKNLIKSYVQGDALVTVNGNKAGIIVAGGTGGDSGAALAGLSTLYYNPGTHEILPYRHNYTEDKAYVETGFFVPSFTALDLPEYVDSRGYCDPEKARAFYQAKRDKFTDPQTRTIYCAEYCFTAEEAFAMEGENKFNKVLLSDQLTRIKLYKESPELSRGNLVFTYGPGERTDENITGVKFIPNNAGDIVILEHPIWEMPGGDNKGFYRNLYVGGIDAIDIGSEETSSETRDPSKFCTIIKKRAFGLDGAKYVAYYLKRPEKVREAYQMAIKLAMYYNCQLLLEKSKVSILTWAKSHGFIKYFMRRPEATYTITNTKRRPTNEIGAPATLAIIDHQTDLIADYIEDSYDTIWFEELLEQLLRYTDENRGKFDMVAAMGMAELADEELQGFVPKIQDSTVSEWVDVGYYIDENGRRRYGPIPKKAGANINVRVGYGEHDEGYGTSDTRRYL